MSVRTDLYRHSSFVSLLLYRAFLRWRIGRRIRASQYLLAEGLAHLAIAKAIASSRMEAHRD